MKRALPSACRAGFAERPVSAWLEAWAPLAPRKQVRQAVRAVYRGEPAWELPHLARRLRQELQATRPALIPAEVLARTRSPDGAEKLLFDLGARGSVESVLIPEARSRESRTHMWESAESARRDIGRRPRRASGCLSTQVGCAVRCTFCASGLEGLAQNLSASQIVAQAVALRALAAERGCLLSTLVLMGMGEPLHNVDALLVALENLTDPDGFELGRNHVTVSTIGVPRGIERLAQEGPAVNLALSLHAPDDATRRSIVPLAKTLPGVEATCALAGWYARTTRRQVSVSYVLLDQVNDHPAQARDLLRLVQEHGLGHVNLIPWNHVEGLSHRAPSTARVDAFFQILRHGVPVHVRRTRGAEAEAACGQLRRRVEAGI